MKLVATIENINEKKIDFIYCDENDILCGFSYDEGLIHEIDEKTFDNLNVFKLGLKRHSVGFKNGYEIILDEESGLKHFFRDGKENLVMLYKENGIENSNYSLISKLNRNIKNNGFLRARKFILNGLIVTLFGIECMIGLFTFNQKEVFYNDGYNGIVFQVPFANNKIFFYGDSSIAYYSSDAKTEDFMGYIKESKNLDRVEKKFLCCEELLADVVNCYSEEDLIIAQVRHTNIDIVPFTEEDKKESLLGFYCGDNLLHIRHYNSSLDLYDEDVREVLGHEYIHLLELSDYKFFKESIAEIASYEYFLKSDKCREGNYFDGVKLTKMLMEIIGPEPVWNSTFKRDCYEVEDAVKPYLNDQDFTTFVKLIMKNPHKLDSDEFNDFFTILCKLYKSKYGDSLYNNKMITAIYLDNEHSRIYFNNSIVKDFPSYCYSRDKISFAEAEKNEMVRCFLPRQVSYSTWANSKGEKRELRTFSIVISNTNQPTRYHDVECYGDELVGIVDFGYCIMPIEAAVKNGLVRIEYFLPEFVSIEDFMEHGLENNQLEARLLQNGLRKDYYLNKDDMCFYSLRLVKLYVDEIATKEAKLELKEKTL